MFLRYVVLRLSVFTICATCNYISLVNYIIIFYCYYYRGFIISSTFLSALYNRSLERLSRSVYTSGVCKLTDNFLAILRKFCRYQYDIYFKHWFNYKQDKNSVKDMKCYFSFVGCGGYIRLLQIKMKCYKPHVMQHSVTYHSVLSTEMKVLETCEGKGRNFLITFHEGAEGD